MVKIHAHAYIKYLNIFKRTQGKIYEYNNLSLYHLFNSNSITLRVIYFNTNVH